jgi:MFS family permease
MQRFSPAKYFSGLSANTFLLASASLFSDISTEMLYPVLPLFLTQTLGASAGVVGLVEGVTPALYNVVQGFSGWLSDKLRRRKPVALAGYLLAAVAKPLIGLATAWTGVFAARSLDRLGAGCRSAPRDALVAASASEAHRGRAFGLEGFGDNLGAFLGPLIAIALLSWLRMSLRSIFFVATVPGLLAALMVLLVRERPVAIAAKAKLDMSARRFPKGYWRYLSVIFVFGLGNSSNAFLILRTQDLGASLTSTILIYALYNLVAALASYPAGYFSDAFGRKSVLLLSFAVFLVVYCGFGLGPNIVLLGAFFALYGLYQGIFRSVGKALATDFVPADLHASGLGWFTATLGISGLLASVVAGELWTRIGPHATFLYGAFFALAGCVALLVLVPEGAAASERSQR